VPERVDDVLAHETLCSLPVARLNSGEDRLMLSDVTRLPVRLAGATGQQAPPDLDDPERVQRADDVFVVRCAGEREVKLSAGVVDRVGFGGVRFECNRLTQGGEVIRLCAFRSQAGDTRLMTASSPRSVTRKPRCGSASISPSPASRRSASRTGVREMPRRSARSICESRAPGAISPLRIRALIWS
jgi:hypothetical protein